jgi:adenosylmethionine-8-amino-7-oxononanoate aminotransferase
MNTLLQHFARNAADPLVLVDADGLEVIDDQGRRHIDALSGLFCAQLGYAHKAEFAAAAAEQVNALPFATNWAVGHPPAIALVAAIADRAPGYLDHVLFTSGGSESVEAAWKLVRHHHLANGEPQRTKAIARDIAYHGVTLGALSFTGVERFKTPFGRAPIDVTHVSNTNAFRAPDGDDPEAFCRRLLDEVEAAIVAAGPDEVALIIAEPVQNSGGCLVPPPGYWRGLRELADRYGALLMADEVISGCGRLGEWFGVAREGVVPDLVSLAKGLTSAYAPMGAVVAREHVAAPLATSVFRHGITFGGHPVCAAIALTNLEIFAREGVLENVRSLEGHLEARLAELRALPIVGDTRGAGFFWAIELVKERDARLDQTERDELLRGFLPRRLRQAGLIARADDRGDSVLQIAPPLISDAALLDEIVDRLGEVLVEAGHHMTAGGA